MSEIPHSQRLPLFANEGLARAHRSSARATVDRDGPRWTAGREASELGCG